MTVVLEVRGVSVAFGGVQALDAVSFELHEGELLGLMGPNGAGKTTAMRAITGVVTPQEGEVRLRGRKLNGLSVERRVRLGLGMSQQIVKPFRSMTVAQNVALAAGGARTANPLGALFQTGRGTETARARELLDLVGMGDAADANPSELPLGYLKRLEVARALALDPQLLLLDEPLAGLNQAEAATFADVITGLNRGGLSIILIEHNLGEVLRICSRLVVLDNGRNLKSGPPQEVMADPAVRAAYLGEGEANGNGEGDDAEAG